MSMRPDPVNSDDLNAYIDGALPDDRRAWVVEQLGLDPILRDELEQLRATAMLLRGLPGLAPRRSFTLGPEFARNASTPVAGSGVRLLPIIRSLSVAAIVIFMVVTGSLFFDIHGDTNDDAGHIFPAQDEILGARGTEPQPAASDDAEDASEAAAPAAAEESGEDADSVDDDPLEDLTSFDQSADLEASDVDAIATSVSSNLVAEVSESVTTDLVGPSPDEDRTSWVWSSVVVGGLALALTGLWFVLAQVGRQPHAGKS